jgi:hypothetical protein
MKCLPSSIALSPGNPRRAFGYQPWVETLIGFHDKDILHSAKISDRQTPGLLDPRAKVKEYFYPLSPEESNASGKTLWFQKKQLF